MLNSGKKFALRTTKKKKYSNSRVVGKTNYERKKQKHNPNCKLNGLSLNDNGGIQHILCCVFALFVFVLCTLCCQFRLIVYF